MHAARQRGPQATGARRAAPRQGMLTAQPGAWKRGTTRTVNLSHRRNNLAVGAENLAAGAENLAAGAENLAAGAENLAAGAENLPPARPP